MSSIRFTIFLLGLPLFFLDLAYGIGWVLGWFFMYLLDTIRWRLLDYVLDIERFSMTKYMAYLTGVMLWIAAPLLISLIIPAHINTLAIFAAYFSSRIVMFITKASKREVS